MTNLDASHVGISIHATHTGGDTAPWLWLYDDDDFNPRHPYGWRPYSVLAPPSPNRFQSTPPIRVATQHYQDGKILDTFQSTPPIRVATELPNSQRLWVDHFNPRHPYGWRPYSAFRAAFSAAISIHATHTGGDFLIHHIYYRCREISIHATHTGGDACGAGALLIAFAFQSTPPIRVATFLASSFSTQI